MIRLSTPTSIALAVAVLLAALSLVTWRQARAIEVLRELDRSRDEISLERAESAELRRRIQYLSSRGRVVPEARDKLDMHVAGDVVLLPGEMP